MLKVQCAVARNEGIGSRSEQSRAPTLTVCLGAARLLAQRRSLGRSSVLLRRATTRSTNVEADYRSIPQLPSKPRTALAKLTRKPAATRPKVKLRKGYAQLRCAAGSHRPPSA